ncbi:MAG: hypothetical protein AAE977_02880 [Thermoplasmataceae archaeon]|jgi:hypothetical protein
MKEFDLDKYDEDMRFQIRLQISLIKLAVDLQKLSSDPSKYNEYVAKRIAVIRNIIGYDGEFSIRFRGSIIFPLTDGIDG